MGRMRERLDLDRDVYELAKERINYSFDMFDSVGVAFSGGKDSTATLMLTLEVAHERGGDQLPLRVIHFDEEAMTDDTHDYVERVAAREDIDFEWYCLPTPHQNACSREEGYWYPWDPELEHKWVRELPPEAIVADHPVYTDKPHAGVVPFYPLEPKSARWSVAECTGWLWPADKYGQVGFFLGIRAEESLARYRMLVMRDGDNWIMPGKKGGVGALGHVTTHPPPASLNVRKAYPIYDWRTQDVWVAPNVLGWDYNRTYDKMSMHGMAPPSQRVAPPWHPEGLGALNFFPACYPDLWARMVERVPGVNTAKMYAATELYNHGKQNFTKADHLTWEEFIREMLSRHHPEMKAHMARRIRDEIRRHYNQTSDPILESAAHPETGVSWHWLFGLASRGDPMNRSIPTTYPRGSERRLKQKRIWRDEYDQMVAEGRLDPKKRSGAVKMSADPTAPFAMPEEEPIRMGDA